MCAGYFQLKFKRQTLNCNLKKGKNPESLLSVNTDLAHFSSLLLRGILAHTCFPICTQDVKCQQRKKQDEVCLCENVHIKDSFHSFLIRPYRGGLAKTESVECETFKHWSLSQSAYQSVLVQDTKTQSCPLKDSLWCECV